MFAGASETAAENVTSNFPVVLLDTAAGKRAVLPLPNWIVTATLSPGRDAQPQIRASSGSAASTMFEDNTVGRTTEGGGGGAAGAA